MGKFNFGESPVKKVAEEIRESRVEEQPAVAAPVPVVDSAPVAPAPTKSKKTENGIVVNVPMEDYTQLLMMKVQTGRTLKELALQAIHEFVERSRVG